MFCPGCGKELNENQGFCPECGMEMTSTPKVVKSVPSSSPISPVKSHKAKSTSRRGGKIAVIITVLIVTGLGIFGIVTFTNWGVSEGSAEYYYTNASPSSIESIHIDVDISDLTINYVDSISAPIIKIEMDYHAEGGFVKDKSTDEIYTISWDNISATKVFYMHMKPFVGWILIHDIDIIVTLRSDIIYDFEIDISTGETIINIPDDTIVDGMNLEGSTGSLNINGGKNITFQDSIFIIYSTGSINFNAENASFLSDIYTEASTGNIDLNFTSGIFDGDITIDLSTGNGYLSLYNPTYTTAGNWDISASTGSIYIDIYQHNQMSNDIVGFIETSTGSIHFDYDGDDLNSGIEFTSYVSTGAYHYTDDGGFEQLDNEFSSSSYDLVPNKYTLTLDVSTGSIYVTGKSQ